MKRSLSYRAVALAVVLVLTAATMNVYAETSPGASELRHEAFLRGGPAIAEALTDSPTPQSVVSASLLPPAPPQAMAAFPQEAKNHRVMLWLGIAVTGVIAGYLIQRSVRNHGKIFGDPQ